MKVKFFAPSYKRPSKSDTQKNYPFVKLVVRESEAEQYKKNGNDILTVPDEVQGNVCRVKNYILKNLFDADCLVLMDDDCKGIYRWENQKKIKYGSEELMEFCEASTRLCTEWGFALWGLNCVTDKGAYREHTPFSTLKFIGGPFQAHLNNKMLYDESLPLKEDYDITLQHIVFNGGCLRFNFCAYDVKQAEQAGGCATYRNLDREKEQFELLQRKWGKDIVQRDYQSRRSFDFNPIIKSPWAGI